MGYITRGDLARLARAMESSAYGQYLFRLLEQRELTCASCPPRLPGVLVIEPDVHEDGRGFFLETYHAGTVSRARHRRPVRAGQSFAVDRRHAARPAPAAAAAAGKADSRHRRRDFRRRRRRAPRLADIRTMGWRQPVGREFQAVLRPARIRARLLRRQRRSRRSNTSARTSTTRQRDRHRLERSGHRHHLAGFGAHLSPRDSRHPTLDAMPIPAARSVIQATKSSVPPGPGSAKIRPFPEKSSQASALRLQEAQVRWSDYGRAP